MGNAKCLICNSNYIEAALVLESPLGGLWDIYECQICGTQFIHPMPSQEELGQFYQRSDKRGTLADPSLARGYWRRQWGIIEKLTGRRSGNVLDFGCWGGHFLDNARQGWEGYGVELSKKARQIARHKGIKAFKTLEQASLPGKFFDVVTMFAVIEHLVEPIKVVGELARVLKTGGLFVMMTGDRKSLKARIKGRKWHMYRPPEHTHFFCGCSLDFPMKALGFTKVKTLYTDGGMTYIPFHPLNMALRAMLIIMERIPILCSIPLLDHNYSYWLKG